MADNLAMSFQDPDGQLMALLDRVAARDEAAFKALYDQCASKLYGLAMRVVGNREWAEDVTAEFPVLIQEKWRVSKSFEVYATPFAFLIDAGGVVRSAGIAGSKQHLGYVLSGAGRRANADHSETGRSGSESAKGEVSVSMKEVTSV